MIDPQRYGVSFSLKQCRNFGLDAEEAMRWLIEDAGFRRFRLMSYWNEHEKRPGVHDFSALDQHIAQATKHGCLITLCLGARQPRWPENHWPNWAWKLPRAKRTEALLRYIEAVVKRYRHIDGLVSYQLENEALLANFGERPEIDRGRLRQEFALVKRLDPAHPIVMTTSTSWGIPVRAPVPDIIGFSYYRTVYSGGRYHHAFHFPFLDRLRAAAARLVHDKPCLIHELQLEPWGPTAIWKMTIPEQNKSMSPAHIQKNVELARKTTLYPVDLWGGEWWYWRLKATQDPSIWLTVQSALQN